MKDKRLARLGINQENPYEGLDPSLVIARLEWRAGLSDLHVRSLCYDFITGHLDDCTLDAYLEYWQRFGQPTKKDRGSSPHYKKSRIDDSSSRYNSAIPDSSQPLPGNTLIG